MPTYPGIGQHTYIYIHVEGKYENESLTLQDDE